MLRNGVSKTRLKIEIQPNSIPAKQVMVSRRDFTSFHFFIDDTFFLMPEIHSMHVKPSYFALLKSGDKLVEFRINDAKRQKISAGDKIKFICQNDLSTVLVLSVSDIATSSDFSSLLKKFPLPMLGGISYEEQLSDLRKFYNMDSEEEYGAIAIILKGLVYAQ